MNVWVGIQFNYSKIGRLRFAFHDGPAWGPHTDCGQARTAYWWCHDPELMYVISPDVASISGSILSSSTEFGAMITSLVHFEYMRGYIKAVAYTLLRFHIR